MVRLLKEILREELGEEASRAYGSFDLIGDLAIIRVPDGFQDKLEIVGNALMKLNKSIHGVWAQVGPVEGDYRIRKLMHVAGEERSITVYRESGCRFELDITSVYFSPRLAHERLRIAQLVNDGETVFNMFAGIGTFSIVMAKRKRVTVHSSEINPTAHQYMIRNIELNKVKDRVIPYLGDACDVSISLNGKINRVLMPLPERALEFFDCAIRSIGNSGWIHVYMHVPYSKGESATEAAVRSSASIPAGKVINTVIVREVGPRLLQVVHDVMI
ncbi:MAG: class I SAM-dependent methyltransferase family protein [Nitrososphaerota archaeon]|jgi:tRNA (guanine37-N1)-methyltransferase|nr:class I SAM-dependent methyltransferase family protein [Nitrososphaerota archaeon]MDG6927008.1 class I SAM-dependent methyltransferase family protein [Nitrososphaerota archaeon]MDG6930431.1 class I SAM-dependent methyltransferase family protein [Nitrososphaerota archaeon]MDG6931472.1 class I SAM-dependent methyltransferase family protein [Nitrososphaerota archaeon]MDG6936423.1 class I SAM-dependent methyltransferase family protein [Nitrososphaerota archaeon]